MIEGILPSSVASVERRTDIDDLFPEEAELVARAVDKRRREFATARWCARKALADLGHPAVPILRGPKNEPLWPEGVVGALTHCDGYRAAAVARAAAVTSLGIDAEPHEELPPGTLKMIARPEEIPMLAALASQHPETHWDKVLFSAKESVYKVWFPLARRWLDFQDATLRFDPPAQTFDVELHQPGLVVGGEPLMRLSGRYAVGEGLVVTAVVIEG
ncbi:4'-phosphopantetheinyl transferase [Catenulispora acidiphila DSM 44928]|uniref:4'-phosphopantetheinyl transferase n=1 Tax=Catenulispora acidiphila (strain DSM 44928 / JCM 14897 / NBRC 102108 / NRRL B-24433 / ID139908) TaxID=479433 RepID=C7Q8Z6_CATAD|nr:4'-phosphopantetheinyl transferase superfamily protein [Catenulispora acidiphila]ACU72316.1 4'-phosphopantetheinyl transferase [Catenulispora acidiphila DSM 44928]